MNNPTYLNIIEKLKYPLVLSSDDTFNIIPIIVDMVDDYIVDNIINYSNIQFKEQIYSDIYDLIYIQMQPIYEEDITDDLKHLLSITLNIYLNTLMPPRSYTTTFIRTKPNFKSLESKLIYLKNKPQPEQRTSEWYKMRHNLITASNAWKSFGSESSKNQLIYSKCIELNLSKYSNTNTASPFHYGIKYEELSIMLYEDKYKTKIEDYGCIIHDKYPFLGASPDGINTLDSSDRFGRMLEVKNIVNRIIDGIPKVEYWVQMQLQMEVCNLNECDFLETRFLEYDNKEDFLNDGTFKKTINNKHKGIIMYFIKGKNIHYEYAPIHIKKSNFSEWEDK